MAADNAPSEKAPAPQEAAPGNRPEPPPYLPDKELIGYVEKGQKPPAPPKRPTEKR
jgi:hypothetical protein